MSWTKSTPYFRVEESFGTYTVYINGDCLALVNRDPSTSAFIALKGVDQWTEFANWLLEQARLYEEGPSDD